MRSRDAATGDLRVVRLDARNLPGLHDGLVATYADVFSEAPWNETDEHAVSFGEALRDYVQSPGFRGVAAVDGCGVPQGFALGLDWRPEHWFCSGVAADLGPAAHAWTSDCFHLLELALRRPYRGREYGSAMYDALMDGLPHRTSILSTNRRGPVAAAVLYVRRGWRILLEGWRHCEECEPMQVLGLAEPGLSVRTDPGRS